MLIVQPETKYVNMSSEYTFIEVLRKHFKDYYVREFEYDFEGDKLTKNPVDHILTYNELKKRLGVDFRLAEGYDDEEI